MGRLDLELGQGDFELGRTLELNRAEVEVGQHRFGLGQVLVRQHQDHGQPVALVGQLQSRGVDFRQFGRPELGGHVHEVGLDLGTVGQVEVALPGVVGIKLGGPVALEVDGVDQDEPGENKDICYSCFKT